MRRYVTIQKSVQCHEFKGVHKTEEIIFWKENRSTLKNIYFEKFFLKEYRSPVHNAFLTPSKVKVVDYSFYN